jgi:hypothetical protein
VGEDGSGGITLLIVFGLLVFVLAMVWLIVTA